MVWTRDEERGNTSYHKNDEFICGWKQDEEKKEKKRMVCVYEMNVVEVKVRVTKIRANGREKRKENGKYQSHAYFCRGEIVPWQKSRNLSRIRCDFDIISQSHSDWHIGFWKY